MSQMLLERSTTIGTHTAETVSLWGEAIRNAGLQSITAGVPSIRVGHLVVPVLGTKHVNEFDRVPFTLTIQRDHELDETVASLVPAEKDDIVGVPVYDPDRIGRHAADSEAASRVGYSALHSHIVEGEGDRSDFALFAEASGGVLLELDYQNEEASTLMAAVKIAASKRLEALAAEEAN